MGKRRGAYKFTEKTHSKRGILVFAVSVLLLAVYGWFVYMAYEKADAVSAYHGSVGVIAMLASAVAFGFSITTFKEEDSFRLFPRLSFVTSLLAVVGWIGTYVLGFIL